MNKPKIALIDNNDSFTYNLVQLFEESGCQIKVINSANYYKTDIDEYSGIILSPGPGLPSEYPIMQEVISKYNNQKFILGVCLGHQALAEYFGAELFQLENIQHGIKSKIVISNNNDNLYKNINSDIFVGRYHSWAVKEPLPINLIATSHTDDGILMSFKHKFLNIYGIQFHPESIITEYGSQIIINWLKCTQNSDS